MGKPKRAVIIAKKRHLSIRELELNRNHIYTSAAVYMIRKTKLIHSIIIPIALGNLERFMTILLLSISVIFNVTTNPTIISFLCVDFSLYLKCVN